MPKGQDKGAKKLAKCQKRQVKEPESSLKAQKQGR
jgi:hypothetical protein